MNDEVHKPEGNGWQRLNEVFAAAVDLNPNQRDEFLRAACAEDEPLRLEVEEMLSAVRQSEVVDFLKGNAFAAGAHVLAQNDISTGTEIAGYRVIREIGRGGMGAVYLAERADFRQLVALKIIKRGMDTDQIVRRFVRERDVLASLNHPNIARLLDGGHTTDGLPFIAMEHIEGQTITAYCDEKRLTIEERIELFRKVCKAVTYAHHNLVVHRDIKPSNILVTSDGEPKLLDFGIAKLLAPDAFDNTVDLTVAGAHLMTPDYASPEQIRGDRVTTATDVYSLGVLLYELLCGYRPFQLHNRTSADILKIISEKEPSAPSTASVTAGKVFSEGDSKSILSPETVADSRRERPPHLRKRLRGDLDNIVLTALRKDPERRYSSVEQFSEDLQRHLSGLPVIARPASLQYQLSKFVRRNRTVVAFASIALIALFVGLSLTIWQNRIARAEKARAEQQAAETRRLASSLITEYDKELGNLPGSYPVRIKLAQASADYLDRLAKQDESPEVLTDLAKAHAQLAHNFSVELGNDKEAEKHLQKAVALAQRVLSNAPNDTSAKELLARILDAEGHSVNDREKNFREALRLREEIVAANPSDLSARDKLAGTYLTFANLLRDSERGSEALTYFRRAIDVRASQIALLEKSELTVDEYSLKFWALAWMGLSQGHDFNDWQTAKSTLERGLKVAETAVAKFSDQKQPQTDLPTAHSYLARALERNADYYGALGHYEVALELNKKASIRFNLFSHHSQVFLLSRVADMLHKTGNSERSLEKLREALALRNEATAVNHADPRIKHSHAIALIEIGKVFAITGRADEAQAVFRNAEEIFQQVLPADLHNTFARVGLARANMYIGDIYANCLPDEVDLKQVNRSHLQEAVRRYQAAVKIFAEIPTGLTEPTKVDQRLAQAKLAAGLEKLKKPSS